MSIDQPPAASPKSILEGVNALAAELLGIACLTHKSSFRQLKLFDGQAFVETLYEAVRRNYELCDAGANKNRSAQNWRWHEPQPQIASHNRSPEVVIERAVAHAAIIVGRTDWSNQIPVASGLAANAGDRRRAIDLVRRRGERHFQLIELKIASDTPLYAAVELLGYAYLWLIARRDRPARPSAMLDADWIELRVLAPAAFYRPYVLHDLERSLNQGVRALGLREGIVLDFAFEVLDSLIVAGKLPEPAALLDLVDHPARLHGQ